MPRPRRGCGLTLPPAGSVRVTRTSGRDVDTAQPLPAEQQGSIRVGPLIHHRCDGSQGRAGMPFIMGTAPKAAASISALRARLEDGIHALVGLADPRDELTPDDAEGAAVRECRRSRVLWELTPHAALRPDRWRSGWRPRGPIDDTHFHDLSTLGLTDHDLYARCRPA